MSDNQNQNKPRQDEDIGKNIERDVQATIDAVAQAVRTVGESLRENATQGSRNLSATLREIKQNMQIAPQNARPVSPAKACNAYSYGVPTPRQTGKQYASAAIRRPVGESLHTGKRVFGAILAGFMGFLGAGLGIASAICAAVGVASAHYTTIVVAQGLGMGALLAFLLMILGLRVTKRLQRFRKYLEALAGRSYCTIEELSAATQHSVAYVRKDLNKMFRQGYFRSAYLDPAGTRLFSNGTAYRLHMANRDALLQKVTAQEPVSQPESVVLQADPEPEASAEKEGETFLQALHAQKEMIQDAPVREQVEYLEQHVAQIFSWLEKHPGSVSQVRRFTGYYLPTTLKLLNTYNEVEQAGDSAVAEEIQHDICDILHKINDAFQTLQNGLLKDTALDVSAEISALETVLAQDGLTQDALTQNEMANTRHP